MRRILNIFSFVLATLYAGNMAGQVKQISYALSFNNLTSQYDCFLIINKGETTSNFHKIQFNSQVSMVVPHGANLELAACYMPFIGNGNQINRKPIDWLVTDVISAPTENKSNDFYTIAPNISQTSFYDDMSIGDKVKLFSIKVTTKEGEKETVNLYENGVDIRINGIDLSNGFSLGGANQIFGGIAMLEIENYNIAAPKEND